MWTITKQRAYFPMYVLGDIPAAMTVFWQAVVACLGDDTIAPQPSFDDPLSETALADDAFLVQHCSYPYVMLWQGQGLIEPLACFDYAVPKAANGHYCSVLVASSDEPASTLEDMRDAKLVINDAMSNSGMNLLRHTLAPLAGGKAFFKSVAESGGHVASMEAVAAGKADMAAIDAVTYAYAQTALPDVTAQLRVLGHSAPSPTLPLFVRADTPQATRLAVLEALKQVISDPKQTGLMQRLNIRDVLPITDADLAIVKAYADQASAEGYSVLR